MRILQINSFFSVGGPPRIMNGIYTTLKEHGDECKIAAAREKVIVPEDSIIIGSPKDTYIQALESRILDNDGFLGTRNTRKLTGKIEEYNPDIIHLHNLHGYYTNVEVLFEYLKQSGGPVIWTLHDCWPATGHCPHFTLQKCTRYIDGCYKCPLKREYPSSYLLDRSKQNWMKKKNAFSGVHNMMLVTPSKWLAETIKTTYLGSYPIKVIHNGIDLQQFSNRTGQIRAKYSLKDKKIILGVAQNWSEHKGFEDFIKLSGLLDDHYQVVMIGLTETQIKALPDRIIGIQRTNSVDELAEWYSNAQVFVNLTYQDTFPTVNIEALACGTPVITYNTGGSPEAIDESSGWVVEQRDIEKAAGIIQTMGEKKQYQEKATARSKQFNRKSKYQEYIDLYSQMLQREGMR